MEKPKTHIPAWLRIKIKANDRHFDADQFTALAFYYKQITGTKLRKNCPNCIADAFIVIKIYIKNQSKK